nr:hypothetical protein [Tanacetum cinerariifolium]
PNSTYTRYHSTPSYNMAAETVKDAAGSVLKEQGQQGGPSQAEGASSTPAADGEESGEITSKKGGMCGVARRVPN